MNLCFHGRYVLIKRCRVTEVVLNCRQKEKHAGSCFSPARLSLVTKCALTSGQHCNASFSITSTSAICLSSSFMARSLVFLCLSREIYLLAFFSQDQVGLNKTLRENNLQKIIVTFICNMTLSVYLQISTNVNCTCVK